MQIQTNAAGQGACALHLSKAILFYNERHACHASKSVASLHPVEQVNERFFIGAGKILTPTDTVQLLRALNHSLTRTEFIPPNVLTMTAESLTWWVKGCRRPIRFKTQSEDELNRLNGAEVAHPALLFHYARGQLYIMALRGNQRPTPQSRLYYAPYYNVWTDGKLCAGTVKFPAAATLDNTDTWVTTFFNASFTHSNLQAGALCRHPRGYAAMWRELKTAKVFPAEYLVERNMDVRRFLATMKEQ